MSAKRNDVRRRAVFDFNLINMNITSDKDRIEMCFKCYDKYEKARITGDAEWALYYLYIIEEINRLLVASNQKKGLGFNFEKLGDITQDLPQLIRQAEIAWREPVSPNANTFKSTNKYPSIEQLESETVDIRLPLSDFRMKQVIGDGHCAFRAISLGVKEAGLRLSHETSNIITLRRILCQFLAEFPDMELAGLTIKQAIGLSEEIPYSQYLRELRKDRFAGDIDIMVLANILQIRIALVRLERENQQTLGHCHIQAIHGPRNVDSIIYICWLPGTSTEKGNHYQLLVKI